MKDEFHRQVEHLLEKRYPEAAGLSRDAFLQQVLPLREEIADQVLSEMDIENGRLPFVIVIKAEFIPIESMMERVQWGGKGGFTKLYPHQPSDFKQIELVHIPAGRAYLLLDIDRGKETINIRPSDAFVLIREQNRSPLTIDEGIALITHYPEFLKKNNCFSLLASRCPDNKRVPAIWINAHKQANLGWCWDGNPHSWLGSASCRARVA